MNWWEAEPLLSEEEIMDVRPARKEFTTLTKLKAMVRYVRCPGVFELGIKCGKRFGSLDEVEFDHIMRNEIEPDNSPENARVLCRSCHALKTKKKDVLEAKKGRHIRRETKKSQKPKAKIRSRPFPTAEQRKAAKLKYEARNAQD